MSDDFIRLVASMRAVQKEFEEHNTRSSMVLKVKLEQKVDEYIQRWTAEKVQLDLWSRNTKSTEEPGVYNVTDEKQKTEGGAA